MRNIKKKEINILLPPHQHSQILRLKETGINMSSLARLAIRKFGHAELTESPDDGAKSKRAVIYMEEEDIKNLESIAAHHSLSKSETLRRLLATYLSVNENALNQLF